MKKHMPGKFAHTLAVIFSLLLTLMVFLTGLSWQGVRVLTDKELHRSVALDKAVADAQYARIVNDIENLAQAQSFAPETVLALVTSEAVQQYNLDVIDWWMGLMQPDPVIPAPAWDQDALQTAVREDALFQEAVRSTQRRAVARDKIAYPIAMSIQESVLPIRTQLLGIAMPKVLERVDVPQLIALASKAPLALGAACVALIVLVVLCMCRCPIKAKLYVCSALAASGILTAAMLAGILLLNPCAMIAQGSTLLALQAGILGKKVGLVLGILAIAEVLVGYLLIALYQHRMARKAAKDIAA